MKLEELGEFGLIELIAAGTTCGNGVITGIGDDAAVTSLTAGMQLLASTDLLIEDIHFRRSWHPPFDLGRKSLAVNISDIAAMGGIPRWALLSLAIPPKTPLGFLEEFTKGFLSIAKEHGVTLIGGDTCRSFSGLTISVTIMGEQYPDQIIRRSGAKTGDDIWVSGTLGDAALALMLLEDPDNSAAAGQSQLLARRLLDPQPRTAAGIALAKAVLVSSMIDISDGLLGDYQHIAKSSKVGGDIWLDAIPFSDAFCSVAENFNDFPYQLALTGGEDYELLFTAPATNRKKIAEIMKICGVDATAIGIVTSSSELSVLKPDGTLFQTAANSFNHFR